MQRQRVAFAGRKRAERFDQIGYRRRGADVLAFDELAKSSA